MKINKSPKSSSLEASKRMKANISRNTGPEIKFRKALWNAGLKGYRLNWKKVPGSPDIAFPAKKIAIFINGCFWHKCPKCKKRLPKENRDYWKQKLIDNVKRDKRKINELKKNEWIVITIWECEIKHKLNYQIKKVIKIILKQ